MPRRKVTLRQSRTRTEVQTNIISFTFDSSRITYDQIMNHIAEHDGIMYGFMVEHNIEVDEDDRWENDGSDAEYSPTETEVEEDEEIPSPPGRDVPWL